VAHKRSGKKLEGMVSSRPVRNIGQDPLRGDLLLDLKAFTVRPMDRAMNNPRQKDLAIIEPHAAALAPSDHSGKMLLGIRQRELGKFKTPLPISAHSLI
jgi:hypothetical protein